MAAPTKINQVNNDMWVGPKINVGAERRGIYQTRDSYVILGVKDDNVRNYGEYKLDQLKSAEAELNRMSESYDPILPNSADHVVVLDIESDCDSDELAEAMMQWSSFTRAINLWFHGAHILAKGAGFAGDHELLYDEIYTTAQADVDAILEKSVGLTQDEATACPMPVTRRALEVMEQYPSPSNASCLAIACAGLTLVKNYVAGLENLYEALDQAGLLTLGLDDLIMDHANRYEGFVYKLQQRVKVEMNK
jgi:hypothetical protein